MWYEVCDMDSYITWPYHIADHYCRITWVYNETISQKQPWDYLFITFQAYLFVKKIFKSMLSFYIL